MEPVSILDGKRHSKVVELQPSVQTRKAAVVDLGKRYAVWTKKQQLDVNTAVTFVNDIDDEDEG
ncbi:hypothetical protein QR721_06455 [Aciduricibacillus chroicocephali]|uniref:Transposase n=1 Tax=Aciduricibacillus chroicocephali TaxID=3054939 RepID=A0ABY9KYN7_9BACI|nr:hypothetical protein QR721_06455 [Bacillaceae bacterium 44XB]